MKYITIFFDYEGKYGMPFDADYDLEKTTIILLNLLKKYKIKAVFNTCGKIIESHPHIVRKISKQGHEISLHGYDHEHIENISIKKINVLLSKSEDNLMDLIGKKPIGFRAPYLMGPRFYNKQIYSLLQMRGYKWCSNREIRFVEEIPIQSLLHKSPFNMKRILSKIIKIFMINSTNKNSPLLFNLLNLDIILKENIRRHLNINMNLEEINKKSRLSRNIYWLNNSKLPILREEILEIPVCSPLDCDLLGLPNPSKNSDKELIEYTYQCLIRMFNGSDYFFNLNFHDWIIGTSNRIELFERILKYLSKQKSIKFVLPQELIKFN